MMEYKTTRHYGYNLDDHLDILHNYQQIESKCGTLEVWTGGRLYFSGRPISISLRFPAAEKGSIPISTLRVLVSLRTQIGDHLVGQAEHNLTVNDAVIHGTAYRVAKITDAFPMDSVPDGLYWLSISVVVDDTYTFESVNNSIEFRERKGY
jgi:hypothetical protein